MRTPLFRQSVREYTVTGIITFIGHTDIGHTERSELLPKLRDMILTADEQRPWVDLTPHESKSIGYLSAGEIATDKWEVKYVFHINCPHTSLTKGQVSGYDNYLRNLTELGYDNYLRNLTEFMLASNKEMLEANLIAEIQCCLNITKAYAIKVA